VSTVLYAMAGPAVRPVIREKSQFRAQHDSLSLSPAHDSTSLYLHFRALGRPFLWAAYFWPQHSRGSNGGAKQGPRRSGRRGQVLWGSGEERGPRPSATRPIGSIRAGFLGRRQEISTVLFWQRGSQQGESEHPKQKAPSGTIRHEYRGARGWHGRGEFEMTLSTSEAVCCSSASVSFFFRSALAARRRST
jgi:hypothetical protein